MLREMITPCLKRVSVCALNKAKVQSVLKRLLLDLAISVDYLGSSHSMPRQAAGTNTFVLVGDLFGI